MESRKQLGIGEAVPTRIGPPLKNMTEEKDCRSNDLPRHRGHSSSKSYEIKPAIFFVVSTPFKRVHLPRMSGSWPKRMVGLKYGYWASSCDLTLDVKLLGELADEPLLLQCIFLSREKSRVML